MTRKRKADEAIRAAVLNPETLAVPTARRAPELPAGLGDRFQVRDAGIFRKNGDGGWFWAFAHIWIDAETRDQDQGGWGILAAWYDRDGIFHEEIFERSLFVGDGTELRGRLALGGLAIGVGSHHRQALLEFFSAASTPKRARSVDAMGWVSIGRAPAFVMGARVCGNPEERILFSRFGVEKNSFHTNGTIAGWREKISILCGGNSRLVFSVACAFAAPLFHIVGESGGGINLRGPSRSGKSTLLCVAASVWGGTPDRGAGGYIKPWRLTGNGLESVAASHSDCLLCLDELGQVAPTEIGEIAYMLANGQGKVRSVRQGNAARPIRQFRCFFLSTGEHGISDANRIAKQDTKAGQETRFPDVPADAGASLGVFEEIHDAKDAGEFAVELSQLCREEYGTAAPAFLEKLIERWQADSEFPVRLRAEAAQVLASWLAPLGEAGGQVRSVGFRFALVAVAGRLAEGFGIVAWPPGEAISAVRKCFLDHLADRGTLGAREDDKAVSQLRDFILTFGPSRFEIWQDDVAQDPAEQAPASAKAPREPFRPANRAGFRRFERLSDGSSAWVYYVMTPAMNEAMGEPNIRAAAHTLVKLGFVLPGNDGKSAKLLYVPNHGSKLRLYHVNNTIFAAANGGAGD